MISTQDYLIVSAILFFIGVLGVLTRKNLFIIFMSIELMLNSVNLTFVTFSRFFEDLTGQAIVFLVIAVAAAEAAIGLSIVILIFKNKESLNIDDFNIMKG
ncbi:MAG: NADH-quinone oxidoreductase subunit K 1 [Candidatus Sericytochromatia bacterium]|nr:MAG: NADH-quinone oxidoreductase subunit K 1 [Candidatus Sericytochromatia bacterium]